jgi:hypothetical protein
MKEGGQTEFYNIVAMLVAEQTNPHILCIGEVAAISTTAIFPLWLMLQLRHLFRAQCKA